MWRVVSLKIKLNVSERLDKGELLLHSERTYLQRRGLVSL